ncbi:putative ATP-dependent RNA helicase dhx33 [Cichlidogyrus casuarinus]|uniref:ATP-dependent RNA helicase dhx33 n=1 Tax=Cichlidogyrus casuarinus TaxID=1844966 RepID=A0ABD2QIS9_9PLAT
MPSTVRKPTQQNAVLAVRKFLGTNSQAVVTRLGLAQCDQSYDDVEFLMEMFNNPALSRMATLLDQATTIDADGSLQLYEFTRPSEPEERNCLDLLSDVWNELETIVLHSDESRDPATEELYDLLADHNVRQLLVACDDIANRNYDDQTDLQLDQLSISSDEEPPVMQGQVHMHPVSPPAPEPPPEEAPAPLLLKGRVKDLANMFMANQQQPANPPALVREKPKKLQQPPGGTFLGSVEDSHARAQERYQNEKARKEDFFFSRPVAAEPPQKPVERKVSEPRIARQQSLEFEHMVPPPEPAPKMPEVEASLHVSDSALEPTTSLSGSSSDSPITPLTTSQKSRLPTAKIVEEPLPVKDFRTMAPLAYREEEPSPASHPNPSPRTRTSFQADNDADLLQPELDYRPAPMAHSRKNSREERTSLLSAGGQLKPVTSGSRSMLSTRDQIDAETLDASAPGSRTSTLQRGRRGKQPIDESWIDYSKLPEPGKPRKLVLRRETHGESLGFTIICRPEDEVTVIQPGFSQANLMQPSKSKKNQETVRNEVVVQRIMAGSLSDRTGILYPGDVILEFNGQPVSSLDQMQSLIQGSASLMECHLVVKAPSRGMMRAHLINKARLTNKIYIRTFFAYDPRTDKDLPFGDVGQAFRPYEVLELVNAQDLDWWQVRKLNNAHGKARLVPSLQMEERRQAQNSSTKKKKSITKLFRAADSSPLLVRSDLWIYEEVVPWPPSTLPCLLLIGPNGVGKRTLKQMLAMKDPRRFAVPITDTTDQNLKDPRYRLLTSQRMLDDIKAGKYVEWGSVANEHYGIRYSAIREIVATGRTAVFDCQISTVHLLHQPEFNPYVVFVAAPALDLTKDMQIRGIEGNLTANKRTDEELKNIVEESGFLAERYRHLYAQKLINDDMAQSVNKLSHLAQKVSQEPGWIPAGWAYELSCPQSKNTSYLPGSSNLHALGIHQLPAGDRSSVIARSVLSGLSGYSEEGAARMARPPSLIGSQLSCGGSDLGVQGGTLGRRLYEKKTRPRPSAGFQPMSPMTEVTSPYESMSDMSQSLPRGSAFTQPSPSSFRPVHIEVPDDVSPHTESRQVARPFSNGRRPSYETPDENSFRLEKPAQRGKVTNNFGRNQVEAEISSTSSED